MARTRTKSQLKRFNEALDALMTKPVLAMGQKILPEYDGYLDIADFCKLTTAMLALRKDAREQDVHELKQKLATDIANGDCAIDPTELKALNQQLAELKANLH